MAQGGQPIFILPEGTNRSVGRDAQRNNIYLCRSARFLPVKQSSGFPPAQTALCFPKSDLIHPPVTEELP